MPEVVRRPVKGSSVELSLKMDHCQFHRIEDLSPRTISPIHTLVAWIKWGEAVSENSHQLSPEDGKGY